jgi:hypothetical protein
MLCLSPWADSICSAPGRAWGKCPLSYSHRDALKALGDKTVGNLDGPRKTIAAARKYGESIVLISTANRADDNKPMSRADFRAERARERAVERFTALDPSARRAAIRVASEKQDFGFLQMLLDEPALIDGATAKAIEMDIARNSNPYAFDCWQDLHGKIVNSATEPDPLTGALPVVAFVIDSTAEWIDEQVGTLDADGNAIAEQASPMHRA